MNIALSTLMMQRGQSGVGQYVLALVKGLLREAPEHTYTLFVLEEDLPLFDFASSVAKIVPVSEYWRPALKSVFWHQMILPGLVRREHAEVLHIPSYRRMLWRRPCALVATIHDLAPFRLAGKYDKARMFYGRTVARRLAQRQHELIAVSRSTAHDVEAFYSVPSGRVTIISNGLDSERFHPGPKELAQAAVSTPKGIAGPFFLYVARLEHPAKNHTRLIEAFTGFKRATGSGWKLVLAGADWHGAEQIHACVRASSAAADIHCLGFVPSSSLPDWYRAAGALVFPSLFEGFGLPAVEAMACGCPVLASAEGALAEVVGSAAGILNPLDVLQMQGQLTRMAADEAWRGQLQAAGLARARIFDWGAVAKATVEVYAKAARHNYLTSVVTPPLSFTYPNTP